MADKVPSTEEFKLALRKEVLKEVKEFEKGVQKKVDLIKDAKPEDLSKHVHDKLANGGGVSYSSLKAFRKSPLSFIEYLTTPFVQTPAMWFGNVVDTMITEPATFAKNYFLVPKLSKRSNRDKAIYELYMELANGKSLIERDKFDEAVAVAESVWKNDDARFYLELSKNPQKWVSFIHRETKIKFRGKIDGESDKDIDVATPFIMDLKTTADADVDPFKRQASKLWYQGQVGGYTTAYAYQWDFRDFVHICVETNSPYNVNVFRSGSQSEYVQMAKEELHYTLMSFKYCLDNNLWHKSYDFLRDGVLHYESMGLPGYYKPKFSDGTK